MPRDQHCHLEVMAHKLKIFAVVLLPRNYTTWYIFYHHHITISTYLLPPYARERKFTRMMPGSNLRSHYQLRHCLNEALP